MKCIACGKAYLPSTAVAPYAAAMAISKSLTTSACACGCNTFSGVLTLPTNIEITNEQIDAVMNGMPNGYTGFLKSWGYRQFARAILDLRNKVANGG